MSNINKTKTIAYPRFAPSSGKDRATATYTVGSPESTLSPRRESACPPRGRRIDIDIDIDIEIEVDVDRFHTTLPTNKTTSKIKNVPTPAYQTHPSAGAVLQPLVQTKLFSFERGE
jgi:hypothetical protein